MKTLEELSSEVVSFRNERDWRQFHQVKSMLLSLMIEVSELSEHFQWLEAGEEKTFDEEKRNKVGDELADVLYWVLLLSHDLDIDLTKAFGRKMLENRKKYPVEQFKGSRKKYNELKK